MSMSNGTGRFSLKLLQVIFALAVPLSVSHAQEAAEKPEIKKHWDNISPLVRKHIQSCGPYLFRSYDIYWTDTPPNIDGEMDDACWKDAQVAGDFLKHGLDLMESDNEAMPPKPRNQTEVRMAYDAENIYVFYKLMESEMGKLVKGQPQDSQDILDVHADAIELFLHPVDGADRVDEAIAANVDYYQICANPAGSTYTARAYGDKTWNADRQIKTQLHDDYWTVEMSIPIRDLYRGDGQASTPKKGETWGVLFCRDQSTYHDWSRWTTSGIRGSGGFHERKSFGRLIFQGRRQGDPLPEAQISFAGPLNFGENQMNISLPPGFEGSAAVFCDGKKTWDGKIAKGHKGPFSVQVSAGGKVLAQIIVSKDGKETQAFYVRKELPRATDELKTIVGMTAPLEGAFPATDSWPEAGAAIAKAKDLGRKAKDLMKVFAGTKVSGEEVQAYGALSREWKAFAPDMACLNAISSAKPRPGAPLAAQLVRATTKVFQAGFEADGHLKEARVNAAGNEYESFQIAVTPLWKDIENLKVEASELKGDDGSVGPENISWFKVDFTEMDPDYRKTLPGFDPDDPDSMRWWPDILWPGTKDGFAAPKGRISTVWVDIFCPPGTKPGEYKGTISLKAGNSSTDIPVVLEANGLELPSTPTLRNNHWYSIMWIYIRARQIKEEMDKLSNMEILQRQLPTLAKYRVSTFPMDMWNLVDSFLEDDGRFTFDFSRMDEAVDYCRKYGANWLCSSFGCNPGGISMIYGGQQPVTIRSSGKKVLVSECAPMAQFYAKPMKTKEENEKEQARAKALLDGIEGGWRGTPYLRAFYPAFGEYLRSKGLLETSYFEANDEAGPDAIIPFWHAFKKIAPALPIMNYGPSPAKVRSGLSCEGYQDLWAPGLDELEEPETLARVKERRIKYGEDYGFYVCGSMPPNAEGRYAPFIKPNESALGQRIIPWFAWKHRCDHFLVFMMFTGLPPTKWPAEPARTGEVGYAPMFYPLKDWTLIPAVRTAHLRDGMEDYEYFAFLHKLSGRLDTQFPPHRELLAKIEKELGVEPDIATDNLNWTKDPATLYAKRERLVKLVKEAEKAVSTYMDDARKK